MKQLYWPETVAVGRYSIPSQYDQYHISSSSSSARRIFFRQTYQTSSDTDKDNSRLLETTPHATKYTYDGLIALDEHRLNDMIETDLVSSTNN